MKNISLYNWDNGSIIIVFVFGFVVIGLVATVLLLMKNDKKKK
jgi:ABC-type multidrug transport system permease subunit